MTRCALEWRSVSFVVPYGFWMRPKTIIDGLELSVPEGAALGLVGPNGAGKTTTIKLGAGLIRPASGQVFINGKPSLHSRSRICLGLLTETQYIYPHLKLYEWLTMAAGLSGLTGADRNRRVCEVLEKMDLVSKANQLMRTLSKGQTQRAGIAQALIHKPSILLLDEPMSGLDPLWRYRIQEILLAFKAGGGTLLFSSHILSDVERLSDEVALIDGGRICWKGGLSEMPRRVKGYEARIRCANPDAIAGLAKDGEAALQADGSWLLVIPKSRRDDLIQAAACGIIMLESLGPKLQEIEEVLFGVQTGLHEERL